MKIPYFRKQINILLKKFRINIKFGDLNDEIINRCYLLIIGCSIQYGAPTDGWGKRLTLKFD